MPKKDKIAKEQQIAAESLLTIKSRGQERSRKEIDVKNDAIHHVMKACMNNEASFVQEVIFPDDAIASMKDSKTKTSDKVVLTAANLSELLSNNDGIFNEIKRNYSEVGRVKDGKNDECNFSTVLNSADYGGGDNNSMRLFLDSLSAFHHNFVNSDVADMIFKPEDEELEAKLKIMKKSENEGVETHEIEESCIVRDKGKKINVAQTLARHKNFRLIPIPATKHISDFVNGVSFVLGELSVARDLDRTLSPKPENFRVTKEECEAITLTICDKKANQDDLFKFFVKLRDLSRAEMAPSLVKNIAATVSEKDSNVRRLFEKFFSNKFMSAQFHGSHTAEIACDDTIRAIAASKKYSKKTKQLASILEKHLDENGMITLDKARTVAIEAINKLSILPERAILQKFVNRLEEVMNDLIKHEERNMTSQKYVGSMRISNKIFELKSLIKNIQFTMESGKEFATSGARALLSPNNKGHDHYYASQNNFLDHVSNCVNNFAKNNNNENFVRTMNELITDIEGGLKSFDARGIDQIVLKQAVQTVIKDARQSFARFIDDATTISKNKRIEKLEKDEHVRHWIILRNIEDSVISLARGVASAGRKVEGVIEDSALFLKNVTSFSNCLQAIFHPEIFHNLSHAQFTRVYSAVCKFLNYGHFTFEELENLDASEIEQRGLSSTKKPIDKLKILAVGLIKGRQVDIEQELGIIFNEIVEDAKEDDCYDDAFEKSISDLYKFALESFVTLSKIPVQRFSINDLLVQIKNRAETVQTHLLPNIESQDPREEEANRKFSEAKKQIGDVVHELGQCLYDMCEWHILGTIESAKDSLGDAGLPFIERISKIGTMILDKEIEKEEINSAMIIAADELVESVNSGAFDLDEDVDSEAFVEEMKKFVEDQFNIVFATISERRNMQIFMDKILRVLSSDSLIEVRDSLLGNAAWFSRVLTCQDPVMKDLSMKSSVSEYRRLMTETGRPDCNLATNNLGESTKDRKKVDLFNSICKETRAILINGMRSVVNVNWPGSLNLGMSAQFETDGAIKKSLPSWLNILSRAIVEAACGSVFVNDVSHSIFDTDTQNIFDNMFLRFDMQDDFPKAIESCFGAFSSVIQSKQFKTMSLEDKYKSVINGLMFAKLTFSIEAGSHALMLASSAASGSSAKLLFEASDLYRMFVGNTELISGLKKDSNLPQQIVVGAYCDLATEKLMQGLSSVITTAGTQIDGAGAQSISRSTMQSKRGFGSCHPAHKRNASKYARALTDEEEAEKMKERVKNEAIVEGGLRPFLRNNLVMWPELSKVSRKIGLDGIVTDLRRPQNEELFHDADCGNAPTCWIPNSDGNAARNSKRYSAVENADQDYPQSTLKSASHFGALPGSSRA